MKKYIKILILILVSSACVQNAPEMKTPENAIEKLKEFIAKNKFVQENYYPGIADEKMRPLFTDKINKIAHDFKKIAESEHPTDTKYQEQIKIGLSRFADVYLALDTEDRERVCTYIEELMDIVGLESSNGQLNNFMYGFYSIE